MDIKKHWPYITAGVVSVALGVYAYSQYSKAVVETDHDVIEGFAAVEWRDVPRCLPPQPID